MFSSLDIHSLENIMGYLESVPYDVNRKSLYSSTDLYAGYIPEKSESFNGCLDSNIYQHYLATGEHAKTIEESLARTLHDHGIHNALDHFFNEHDHRCCVGIMGGHALQRTDKMFGEITRLSKQLTEMGYVMLSGGGPGAMEATHLGAWMAGHTTEEMEDALSTLSVAPSFKDEGWLRSAFEVMRKYPQRHYVSLGIPTWLYGHEPSTPFATHIAKFFENSIREDNILTLAFGGIIYTPGSAGTMQEIFQDAVQNHYLSFGFASPMIFLGESFWTKEMPVYPLLEGLMAAGKYKNLLLTLTDDPIVVIDELQKFRNDVQK